MKLFCIFVIVKVRLVKKHTITKFVEAHRNSKISFDLWLEKLNSANWENINDLKLTFGAADLLDKHSNRIVFNIGGNNYRMICTYHFGKTNVHLFIKWIGTHAEYDKLCNKNLQYTINKY